MPFYLRNADARRYPPIDTGSGVVDYPGDRPVEHSPDMRPPPWIEATDEEIRDAITATGPAFEAWARAGERIPAPPDPDPVILQSPDGARWALTIGNDGTIGRRKL